MAISDRKQIALEQKLDALQAEFQVWLDDTQPGCALEKHNTQVLALTGHLLGLSDQTCDLFQQAKTDHTVLADARNIESLVLGLRRIWEFFRSKLVQRHAPAMRRFLRVADELAWACYKPMLDLCSAEHREPPLVFLNGGLSPYTLSRDQAFLAEDVPGQALTGRTYDPILEHLPIPVIGVPWYQVAHLPDLPVVAHEVGHAVEQDFRLHDLVLSNLKRSPGAGSARMDHWTAWSKEIFADLWGCLTLGPAYVSSLIDFLAGDQLAVQNEIATAQASYPTATLRILLCVEALNQMDFTADSATLGAEWKEQYPHKHAMSQFEVDLCSVVKAVLAAPLDHPGLPPLMKIEDLRFGVAEWDWAKAGANRLDQGRCPTDANTIRRCTAAARYLYDQSPEQYVARKHGDALLKHAETLIQPGTRAGEAVVDEEGKENISQQSRQEGRQWFQAFAQWAQPSSGSQPGGATNRPSP